MFIFCEQIIIVQYMGACSTFSLKKKMFQSQGDPLRTGSLELLHVPVEGKRSTGQILTLWREIPGFRPALSYRISSAFLHIISVIGFKKPSIICHQMLIKPFIIDYNHENFEKNLPFFVFSDKFRTRCK